MKTGRFSKKDLDFIAENADHEKATVIAEKLDRPIDRIIEKIYNMGKSPLGKVTNFTIKYEADRKIEEKEIGGITRYHAELRAKDLEKRKGKKNFKLIKESNRGRKSNKKKEKKVAAPETATETYGTVEEKINKMVKESEEKIISNLSGDCEVIESETKEGEVVKWDIEEGKFIVLYDNEMRLHFGYEGKNDLVALTPDETNKFIKFVLSMFSDIGYGRI